MKFLVISILALLLFASCREAENKPAEQTEQQLMQDSSKAVDSLETDSTISPSKALNLSDHGHGNVPKIAEKAHQNPIKQGKMQSKIRRGTPMKRRAMQSTMKKKSQHIKDREPQ